jgi:hypothetical protein
MARGRIRALRERQTRREARAQSYGPHEEAAGLPNRARELVGAPQRKETAHLEAPNSYVDFSDEAAGPKGSEAANPT